MPRTLLGDEIIESLSSVAAYREVVGTHGDSTTSVLSVVGSNTDTVVAGANFSSNDPAYIAGDQGAELNEISSIATNVIAGAPTINAVPAATSKTPVAYISVGGELTFRFGLLGFNIENLQTAFGAPESVQGTGTPADPYRGAIGRAAMGGQGLLCIKFTGLRKDGWTVELDAVGCSITGSPTANASGKTARPIPVEGRCLTHVINIYK
jgi:hypothetical protein